VTAGDGIENLTEPLHSQSVCGRAARRCAQTVVADVRSDPGFAPHREIAAAARLGRSSPRP
jgi:putative methionine-R-sulfoxide reductase with GAF domain